MAEEKNMHVKVAMAEVFGLVLIGFIATLVGMFGLEQYDDLNVIIGVAPTVGLLLLVATIVAYLNENILLTGIFGVLALFLMAFEGIIQHDAAGATAIAFVGVILLVMALVSFAQPVKMLPILLIVAGIAFILLALWWAEGDLLNNDYRMITGVFWTLVAVIAVYMAAAISLLVVKGKPVLPLLIKA
ncbi:MAG: hypothetical protein HPY73_00045 [Methanomassiliicoccales archaeon]|nr:MAG: hypothetical protein HPY73_00045 [Methanomassiliicoccales archaeon]